MTERGPRERYRPLGRRRPVHGQRPGRAVRHRRPGATVAPHRGACRRRPWPRWAWPDRAEPRAYTLPALAAELAPGDIVVSMLPAPEHGPLLARLCRGAGPLRLLQLCLGRGPGAGTGGRGRRGRRPHRGGSRPGHRPPLRTQPGHPGAARRSDARTRRPRTRLTSYCGGIPAVPNDFRYRFSWAPAGVLNALRSPARYIEDGAETTTDRPWEATRPHGIDGETFEVYPNRDSVPFVAQYGLPAGLETADLRPRHPAPRRLADRLGRRSSRS